VQDLISEHKLSFSSLLALGGADCLMTVSDVARAPRLSKATVYKLVADGKLSHVRIGNAIRFVPGRRSP
jgi:excisionase family DNA binding protein